jgi:hypothetical protein
MNQVWFLFDYRRDTSSADSNTDHRPFFQSVSADANDSHASLPRERRMIRFRDVTATSQNVHDTDACSVREFHALRPTD